MIREKRNKEKLCQYYHHFINEGVMDPNVHPWVAESWQESRELGVNPQDSLKLTRLSQEELSQLREKHQTAIAYLNNLYQQIHEYFNIHNLSLFLLDANLYVLKSYALPFFQKIPGEVEGARLSIQDIGTSSISIAYEHQVPFLLFGPEMWLEMGQTGDACSAPIFLDGEMIYMINLVSVQDDMDHATLNTLLLTLKYAMESHLKIATDLASKHTILDSVPLAVYQVQPSGRVVYSNQLGESRLSDIQTEEQTGAPNLSDLVLNYHHTPINKGFLGVPSYNKEVTWITNRKTYEDITTVVPIYRDEDVSNVVVVSLPIEDLRTLVAHAAGYIARYSLACMIGESPSFIAMKEKAQRIAKHDTHVLLQGEPGTGKQRLAHGIHQASPRAAGPLIAMRCGDMPLELLEAELFGVIDNQGESLPGKLELANGGTLFLDEIEKLPVHLANRLADALLTGKLLRANDTILRSFDVRIIGACDSDLKRLTERGVFSEKLYHILSRTTLRIPPLRLRDSDIPVLADHIVAELAEQHRMEKKTFSTEAHKVLQSYDWPGNIKQLQGVVEQAFFHTEGALIESTAIQIPGTAKHDKAWKEDKEVFVAAWRAAGGNISRLANMLDVSRVTLYRYLKKYGLEKQ